MRWAQEQRLEFIERHLQMHGTINRADIMKEFRVAAMTASQDLNRFKEMHPGRLKYDMRAKCYVDQGNET